MLLEESIISNMNNKIDEFGLLSRESFLKK